MWRIRLSRCAVILLVAFVVAGPSARFASADPADDAPLPKTIHFNRDIRPILSEKCFTCHGPNEKKRKADLRFDTKEGAFADLGGYSVIEPGDSGESEMYLRLVAEKKKKRMPPPRSKNPVTKREIELIRRWIDQGAKYENHWSFNPPLRSPLPEVTDRSQLQNPIDYFIQARLEQKGLSPAPEADKATLIRRATFDLTGLPPTPGDIDAFLADDTPGAYERLVDRLLDSSRFGEHMARYWLDAARYGDTHGLHLDSYRSIWPYRDWVVSAINKNMPFDQFTIEQLAGDLLPNPSLDQLIASGFNRCNVTTSEGGSIDEEYYVRYAVDRVETTSTVWMGLTLGCSVCHDHKFDPFSQKEFYQLFAYFNSLTEKPMDGNAPNPPPVVKVPSPSQRMRLAELDEAIKSARASLEAPMPEVDAAQAAWEAKRFKKQWSVLDPSGFLSVGGASLRKLKDKSVLAEGFNPDRDRYEVVARTDLTGITAVRLEALTHESLPNDGPGRSGNANYVLSEFEAEAISVKDQSQARKVKFVSAHADYSQANGGYLIEKAIDGAADGNSGWAVDGDKRHENRTAIFVASEPVGFAGGTILRFSLRHDSKFKQHAIGRFRLSVLADLSLAMSTADAWHVVGPFEAQDGGKAYATAYGPEKGVDLAAAFQGGSLKWIAKPKLADGQINKLSPEVGATYLFRTIRAPSPRRITLSLGSNDGLKVWLNDKVVLDRNVQRGVAADQDKITVNLQAGGNKLLLKVVNYGNECAFYYKMVKDHAAGELLDLIPLLATPIEKRTPEQKKKLRDYYRRNYSPKWKTLEARLAKREEERKQVEAQIPTTLVMKNRPKRRDAFVLIRGQYDKKGEKVRPGVPSILPPLPEGAEETRLSLARWLVNPAHPLTARVTVNRYWQQYFGTAIVKTTEDFGSRGGWPSHPKLLDWLACEFMESGWDVKHIQKLIVTSAAYRRSSKITPEQLEADPDNRLLSRGPRFRLDAEVIRDNALAISGLLTGKMGGPSVKPYQPPGLWKAVGYTSSNTANFKQDTGEKIYRRSLYTFWKRTSPPPTMVTFDAPSRESCTVRRARTNTPLQALVLMNDTQFVEAARFFAQRILEEGGADPEHRVRFAFRAATARWPDPTEAKILLDAYRTHLEEYRQNTEAARKLLRVGDGKSPDSMDPSDLAAWTMVASMILNLDETITKG